MVAEILHLDSKVIDSVIAFPQADLDVPVYMEMPAGMQFSGDTMNGRLYLLKLKKSLYGLKQSEYALCSYYLFILTSDTYWNHNPI